MKDLRKTHIGAALIGAAHIGAALLIAAVLMAAGCKSLPVIIAEDVLESPDRNLQLTFGLLDGGVPAYTLEYKGQKVVDVSRLGFDLADGSFLKSGFNVYSVDFDSCDETWNPVWGEEREIRNHYNEMLVTLEQGTGEVRAPQDGVGATDPGYTGDPGNASGRGAVMCIRFRLYDDGMALRYEFPRDNKLRYFNIKEELTEFAMTGDHNAWWISGDYDTQEYNYSHTRLSGIRARSRSMRLGNASATGFSDTGVQTALQMKTDDGLYINIHEAAVVNYPRPGRGQYDLPHLAHPRCRRDKGPHAGPLRDPLAHRDGRGRRPQSAGIQADTQPQRALRPGRRELDPPGQIYGRVVGNDHRQDRVVLHLGLPFSAARRDRLRRLEAPRQARRQQ